MVCLIKGGPRRVNHAAVAVGDKIFSFGGKKKQKKRKPLIYNTQKFKWH